ncbi:MAG: hypothetical protein ACFFCQ_13475 [Promethearchaeota archaeon]
MIIVTTSRHPSRQIRTSINFWAGALPQTQRITRGSMNLKALFEIAIQLNAQRLILLSRIKGNPGLFSFYFLNREKMVIGKRFRVVKSEMNHLTHKIPQNINEKLTIIFRGDLLQETQDFFREFFFPILTPNSSNSDRLIINSAKKGIMIFVEKWNSKIIYSPIFYLKEIRSGTI